MGVTVSVIEAAWTCEASFSSPLAEDEQKGFDFLMALDPVFTLRFEDDSTLVVNVAAEESGGLTLTAYEPTETADRA